MPKRKFTQSAKYSKKARRTYKRRASRRLMRSAYLRPFKTKRYENTTTLVELNYDNTSEGSHNEQSNIYRTFSLGQVRNYSEFTNLFQKYRIRGVSIEYRWVGASGIGAQETEAGDPAHQRPQLNVSTVPLTDAPCIWHAVDTDRELENVDIGDMKELPHVKRHILRPNKIYKKYIRWPKTTDVSAYSVSSGSVGTSSTSAGKWITTETASIPHCGWKAIVDWKTPQIVTGKRLSS